jgi:type I restriction enzyme M protein
MFYNTGISTYIWVLSNRKAPSRAGKVQLIDASGLHQKMRKSLGSKRKELSDAHIDEICRLYGAGADAQREGAPVSRVFPTAAFGYRTITIERPARDAAGQVLRGEKGKGKGKPVADAALRDTENVPCMKTWGPTSPARCCRTRPTPGSTMTRPRSATRSPSIGTSMCSSRRGPG